MSQLDFVYKTCCSTTIILLVSNVSFFSLFGLHGEGLDCGDDVAQWFDRFLGKEGHRLFTSRSSCLKRRELKEDNVWGDSVQSTDKVKY